MQNVVRETELQLNGIALDRGAVTHANQGQLALEALAHAGNHIGHQSAHGTRHGIGVTRFVSGGKRELAFVQRNGDVASQGLGQGAQRALDSDLILLDVSFDTLGQFDRILSDT
ncbi:hypothetical protein G6F65_020821 [Rhizopus arrhizus]|nr:hypothetical protein G6F65_020821 [Rhizopus arrhizus]